MSEMDGIRVAHRAGAVAIVYGDKAAVMAPELAHELARQIENKAALAEASAKGMTETEVAASIAAFLKELTGDR